MTINFRASAELMYVEMTSSAIKDTINRMKAIGINTIDLTFGSESMSGYIAKYKTSVTDPLKDNIPYASSLGINFKFRISHGSYGDRNTFYSNISGQTALLNDMQWLVNRYPSVMLYELEEMHRYTTESSGAQAARNGYNALWLKMKPIMVGKIFGFNTASSQYSSMMAEGVDIPFINTNNIFQFYSPQAVVSKFGSSQAEMLNGYISEVNTSKSYFPNIQITPWVYIQSSGFLKCCCPTGSTYNATTKTCVTTTGTVVSPILGSCIDQTQKALIYKPACYNQGFFAQLKWLKDNGYSFTIFRGNWILDLARGNFPGGSSYAGTDLKEMIASLLGTSIPICPTPNCGFTITEA